MIQETLRSGWINGQDGDRLVLKADEDFVSRFDWAGRRPRGLGGLIVRAIPQSELWRRDG